jgi:peptidoglycan/LPS O-acetylase OafA/YrhL
MSTGSRLSEEKLSNSTVLIAQETLDEVASETPSFVPNQDLKKSSSDPGGFVHIMQLDGIRGMAIAFILVYHLLWSNSQTGSAVLNIFSQIRGSLWVGVDLFFALSGFLITGILYDALSSKRYLLNFYGRRCVRIFPLYYLSLAVFGLVAVPMALHWSGYQWALILYLQNTPYWLLHEPTAMSLTGHLWSLAVEEQFYLCWPLIVMIVRDRRRLMGITLMLSVVAIFVRWYLVAHGAGSEITYKMLPCRMDGLLIGGWLALAVRGPGRDQVIRWSRPVFLATFAILLGWGIYSKGLIWEQSKSINTVGYTLLAVCCSALIGLTLNPTSSMKRLFSVHPLRWLGRYSYGIYVWHMLCGALLLRPLYVEIGNHTHAKALQVAGSGAIAILASILLGVISFHVFEVHFLHLKRFFAYRQA